MSTRHARQIDILIALVLALAGLAGGLWVALNVTERLPHLEDEIAYLFQARVFARGALWAPPPPDTRAFFTPFVLVVNGRWVGKYTIGWPLILALGERFGAGWLVNPILGGLTAALIYLLGRDLVDRPLGTIAGILAVTSPFFLIQSGSLMSHAAACLWLTVLMWAWLRIDLAQAAGRSTRGWAVLGGLALGLLILTRPFSGALAAAPFATILVVRLIRRPHSFRAVVHTFWPLALAALLLTALQPLYLAITTGSPTTNLYTLVWPYDRIGFGPGFGPHEGHTLQQGLITTRQGLRLWQNDLFGWRGASWLPLLPGLIFGVARAHSDRKGWPLLLLAPFLLLVIGHVAYWVGAQVYGPRYYYEAHAGLAILAAWGLRSPLEMLAALPGWLRHRTPLQQPPAWHLYLTAGLVIVLVVLNVTGYLPRRVADWRGLYGITRAPVQALEEARQDREVLVLVEGRYWREYGAYFALNSPWLDGPVVAAHNINPAVSEAIIRAFPGRDVWYASGDSLSRSPPPVPAGP